MSWRGTAGGIAAARQGHQVVMTPTQHCYFDFFHTADPERAPVDYPGVLPFEQVYQYDPAGEELTEQQRACILGVQGNIWTEWMPSYRDVEYMAYPRAIALSEVAWTPVAAKNYAEFRHRLQTHLRRLDYLGVNYRAQS